MQECQFGFMPGRSTTDALFRLKQTVEKQREGRKDINVVFKEIRKGGYDRIPREDVWRRAREHQVQEKYTLIG